jgi:hypothetical protein
MSSSNNNNNCAVAAVAANVVPASEPIYSHRGVDDKLLTKYYSSFHIHWSDDFQWKVHLGSVVAISTPNLTLRKLQDWEPNHFAMSSAHSWKIGLVLALKQVASPKHQQVECTVQWLHKALDLQKKHIQNLKTSCRPYKKQEPRSKLPHILLKDCTTSTTTTTNKNNNNNTSSSSSSTNSSIETLDPSVKLLPVQITMLTKEEFGEGVLHEEEVGWKLRFHCPKYIAEDGNLKNEDPDPWAMLNAAHKSNDDKIIIPRPLQQAWGSWNAVKETPELLQNLIRGFRHAMEDKHKLYIEESKRAASESRKAALEQYSQNQQQQQEEEESSSISPANNNNKNNKRKATTTSSRKAASSTKKIRIQEPTTGEEEEPLREPPKRPPKGQTKPKSSLTSSKLTNKRAQAVANKAKGAGRQEGKSS